MESAAPESTAVAATVPPSRLRFRQLATHVTSIPWVGAHFALIAIPFIEFSWWYLAWVVVLTRFIGIGVTAGLHRYFAHRSFKTTRWFQFLLAVVGSTALQKGALWWAVYHRLHHKHSDTVDDPHSPIVGGFLHGHFGWLFTRDFEHTEMHLVRDLAKYPELAWLERFWLVPPMLLAGACFALGGWGGLVYGYCLSVVLVFQVTFAVNSFGHLFGPQRFNTGDGSRNNYVLGYLAMGDGWHNNHHRAPYSARHGFAWYEFDLCYRFIQLLALVGLVWDVKVPPAALLAGHDTPEPPVVAVLALAPAVVPVVVADANAVA